MKRYVMAGLLALCSVPLVAQYGARNPTTCPSRKEPARGGPSAAQAIKYFTCDNEYIQDWTYRHELHLVSDVKAEVGSGRQFDITADHPPSNEGINPAELVYPIKGSFVSWTCGPMETSEPGKNCMKYTQHGATGSCYKTTSGDWYCRMIGRGAMLARQPPPK